MIQASTFSVEPICTRLKQLSIPVRRYFWERGADF